MTDLISVPDVSWIAYAVIVALVLMAAFLVITEYERR